MATIAEALALALEHHQAGRLQAAEPLYRQILQANPAHAEAYHLLGILSQQTGQTEAAAALIRQAIGLDPAVATYHFNLANILKGQGKIAGAINSYRQAVQLHPQFFEALVNLAGELRAQAQFEEAALFYQKALQVQPNHAGLHNNLGLVLRDLGRRAEAIECFRRAIQLEPRYADALDHLGMALREQGNSEEAGVCCRLALQINSSHASALNTLGTIHQDLGEPLEATDCFRKALAVNPDNASALFNLGTALMNDGQLAEAAECFRKALCSRPDYASAHLNLGNALKGQGKVAEAKECYQQALRLNPNFVEAINNLGSLFFELRQLAEADECFQRALILDAGNKLALWNRSLVRLLQGNFEEGWRDFEMRLALPGARPRSFQQPSWDGASLEGKTILVYAERGLGDTLQFIRYLPMVKERGGKVLLECQASLLDLLAGIPGVDQLILAGTSLPAFDVQLPLFSLPRMFGTTLTTIPPQFPALKADPKLVAYWKKELGGKGEETRANVGIVWRGSLIEKNDPRSLPLKCFESLAKIANVRLISLQVGQGRDELARVPFGVTDLGKHFNPDSLADLAAAMMSLDLLVTVDTSVPHLAGALGVPVWVALSFAADWRWLLNRSDSPWYPTMRLFRQSKMNEWSDVFESMAAELRTSQTRLIGARFELIS